MNCREIQENNLHERFLFNELRGAQLREYQEHVRRCKRCQQELRKQRLLIRGLQEIGLEAMKEEIRRQVNEFGDSSFYRGASSRTRIVLVVLSLLLVPALIYFFMFHTPKATHKRNPRLEKFLKDRSPSQNAHNSRKAEEELVRSPKMDKAFQYLESNHKNDLPNHAGALTDKGSSTSSPISREESRQNSVQATNQDVFQFFRRTRVSVHQKEQTAGSEKLTQISLYKFKSGSRYILANIHTAADTLPTGGAQQLPARFPVEVLLNDSGLVIMDWFVNKALRRIPPEQLSIKRTGKNILLVQINGQNRYRISLTREQTEAHWISSPDSTTGKGN